MPEIPELNRRHFLTAAAATCACALSCSMARVARADEAEDDDDEPTKAPPPVPMGKTDVGTLADYAKDGVTDKWLESRHFIVVRQGGKLYALSAVCSHKAGMLKVDAKNGIQCTKHKSLFTNAGEPTKGPATKSGPLMRHPISLDGKGRVVVDNSEKIDQEDWNKKEAFVAVK